VSTGRLVEACVQVLEEPLRDLPPSVKLVERSNQEGLVQHGGQQRVRNLVPGHINERNPSHPLTLVEVFDDIVPARPARGLDPRRQVEPLLEVDVDKEVAAHRSVESERPSPDVDAVQLWHVARLRLQLFGDLAEVLQFTA
jgi:hypothetical protein